MLHYSVERCLNLNGYNTSHMRTALALFNTINKLQVTSSNRHLLDLSIPGSRLSVTPLKKNSYLGCN